MYKIICLFELNKQFGAKFTLFIPSNHHGDAKLSENKNWVNELLDAGIFELAAHGHFHQTSDKNKFGECEFYELNNPSFHPIDTTHHKFHSY